MLTAISSLLLILVAVYILAIVTDEYFVVSLDQIAERLNLPHDVAGASLMAMGSSAPELAIALLALFSDGGAHSDVGVGTIVGSAVFNILVITGISAIVRPARVTGRVVVRDMAMYLISVAILLVTVRDGHITLFEASLFLLLYVLYLILLLRWESVAGQKRDIVDLLEAEIDRERKRGGLFSTITQRLSDLIGLLMGDPHTAFLRAFAVSILFIAALSWVLVENAVTFADAIGIPPVIVALTILAGGTSIPDLFASIVVSRQGRGEMAVANAVGSNIFDILVGLGLPWVIALGVRGQAVTVGTGDLWVSTLILFATVILLFIFLMTQRLLSRLEGWLLLLVYVAYVLWTWLGG